jgi:multiple sugar transport system permease protein
VKPLRYAGAFAALLAALAPIAWMLTVSVKADEFAPQWFGFRSTWAHYANAFAQGEFLRYFLNSAIVAVGSVVCALVLGIPAAYGLARFPWPREWGSRISFWVLSTRMLPPIVTVIPAFFLLREIHLLNSLPGLILVYAAFNLPFVVWMMRGFFEEVSKDIEEAAMLDGESRLGILLRIVLPMVRPGVAATATFCLIVAWNELLFALILTQTDSAMTLPVGIASRVTQYQIEWGAMSAAGAVAMVPVVAFAFFAQRALVRGLSLGAVKG